jgi:hypothetical protein
LYKCSPLDCLVWAWYVCQLIYMLLRIRYWLTQLLISVHSIPDRDHPSLVIPTPPNPLRDRQLRLVSVHPVPIVLFSVHILVFTTNTSIHYFNINQHEKKKTPWRFCQCVSPSSCSLSVTINNILKCEF